MDSPLTYPEGFPASRRFYEDLPVTLPRIGKLLSGLCDLYGHVVFIDEDKASKIRLSAAHLRYRQVILEKDVSDAGVSFFRYYEQQLPLLTWISSQRDAYLRLLRPTTVDVPLVKKILTGYQCDYGCVCDVCIDDDLQLMEQEHLCQNLQFYSDSQLFQEPSESELSEYVSSHAQFTLADYCSADYGCVDGWEDPINSVEHLQCPVVDDPIRVRPHSSEKRDQLYVDGTVKTFNSVSKFGVTQDVSLTFNLSAYHVLVSGNNDDVSYGTFSMKGGWSPAFSFIESWRESVITPRVDDDVVSFLHQQYHDPIFLGCNYMLYPKEKIVESTSKLEHLSLHVHIHEFLTLYPHRGRDTINERCSSSRKMLCT